MGNNTDGKWPIEDSPRTDNNAPSPRPVREGLLARIKRLKEQGERPEPGTKTGVIDTRRALSPVEKARAIIQSAPPSTLQSLLNPERLEAYEQARRLVMLIDLYNAGVSKDDREELARMITNHGNAR